MSYLQINKANILVKVVITALLLFLVTGCGNSAKVRSSSELLHIDAEAVDCHFDHFFSDRGNLVLKDTHPNHYDSGELQQLESYVQTLGAGKPQAPLPSLLERLPGGSSCGSGLQITNISQNTVQIESINMRVTSTPFPNTTHYDLIDTCSLLSGAERVFCPGSFGGGAPLVNLYDLKKASVGSLIFPQDPNPIVLKPSDTAYIGLIFSSTGIPDNFTYTLAPELALTTGSMKLGADAMKVILADKDQFACVQLSKNIFVSESPIPPPALADGSPSGHWCV